MRLLIFSLLNFCVPNQTVILIDKSSSDVTWGWFFFFFTIMNKKWNNRDEYLNFPHSSIAWVTSLLTRIIVSNTGSTCPQMCYLQCNSNRQDTLFTLTLPLLVFFIHHFCKLRQSPKQNIRPCFVALANFCSVNAPTGASLQLPAWSHCTWSVQNHSVMPWFQHQDATDPSRLKSTGISETEQNN